MPKGQVNGATTRTIRNRFRLGGYRGDRETRYALLTGECI